jgi:iduronate 2-sulfatase
MAALKQLGLDKNTIVVLWADHGWHLGDYGVWGKDTNFDIALRSPLIIKMPGMKAPGKSTNSIAETVDIFPTLADVCGLPTPNHVKNNGTSLKPIIQDPRAKVKDHSISVRDFAGLHGTTIRNDRYRLMINVNQKGDTTELALFDNYERPIPHTNIADKHPDIVHKLKKELAKY